MSDILIVIQDAQSASQWAIIKKSLLEKKNSPFEGQPLI